MPSKEGDGILVLYYSCMGDLRRGDEIVFVGIRVRKGYRKK